MANHGQKHEMNNLKVTNILLLIIAIPIVIIVLKTLKFIFVPLAFAMFLTLLFIPLMRRLKRKKVTKVIRVLIALTLIVLGGMAVFQVLNLSSQEILSTKDSFIEKAESKIDQVQAITQNYFGFPLFEESGDNHEVKRDLLINYAQEFSMFLIGTVPQLLTTLFFVVLLLFESFDFEKLLHSTILKKRHTSIKAFTRIEKDLVKFLQVKFLVSLGTGIGTGLVCYAFDVSFPIFWGFFAFAINFVQMVGSIISIVMCSLFALVEMEIGMSLLYFVISVSGVQVIFGSILEPIFMGKSFSINIIVVLIMLMFWGFVWGVPGMILSIPITVFIKIILEQFDKTKPIAKLMN